MALVVVVEAFLGVLALVIFVALVVIETFLVSEPSGEPDLDVLLPISLLLSLTRVGLK
jgi:hypothetical protein